MSAGYGKKSRRRRKARKSKKAAEALVVTDALGTKDDLDDVPEVLSSSLISFLGRPSGSGVKDEVRFTDKHYDDAEKLMKSTQKYHILDLMSESQRDSLLRKLDIQSGSGKKIKLPFKKFLQGKTKLKPSSVLNLLAIAVGVAGVATFFIPGANIIGLSASRAAMMGLKTAATVAKVSGRGVPPYGYGVSLAGSGYDHLDYGKGVSLAGSGAVARMKAVLPKNVHRIITSSNMGKIKQMIKNIKATKGMGLKLAGGKKKKHSKKKLGAILGAVGLAVSVAGLALAKFLMDNPEVLQIEGGARTYASGFEGSGYKEEMKEKMYRDKYMGKYKGAYGKGVMKKDQTDQLHKSSKPYGGGHCPCPSGEGKYGIKALKKSHNYMERSTRADRMIKRLKARGTRQEVFAGHARRTSGGLFAKDLMVNKRGKLISVKMHHRGKGLIKKFT